MNEQPFDSQLNTILDECLDAILHNKATIESCLQQYPDYADDLLPELQVALLTSRLKSPVMAASSVDSLEAKLMAQFDATIEPTNVIRPSFFRTISRSAAAAIIIALLLIGAGGGAVYAAADDMPGDTLYGVKRFWETIVTAIASVIGQLDNVWLQLAQTRLDELLFLNTEDAIPDPALLADFTLSVEQAIINADADTTPELINFLDESRALVETHFSGYAISDNSGYDRVLHLLTPHLDANGDLMLTEYVPQIVEPTVIPTLTPTVVFSPTAPPTQTTTDIPEVTPTATATVVTATPTPSRTPTLTPTLTLTPTATLTVTPSWTPIDYPDGPPPTSTMAPPPVNDPGATPVPDIIIDQTLEWEFLRSTERAVYLTQTAIAEEAP